MYETQSPLIDGEVDEKALIESTIEQWVLADELGYDYIWLVEHHFLDTFSISSSPDILYGAASRLTKNIRLGFGVVILPQHHPVRVAEKIAMGRLNKFFKETTLLNQVFIRDNKKTVQQFLKETSPDLTVTDFKRISLSV